MPDEDVGVDLQVLVNMGEVGGVDSILTGTYGHWVDGYSGGLFYDEDIVGEF